MLEMVVHLSHLTVDGVFLNQIWEWRIKKIFWRYNNDLLSNKELLNAYIF